MSAKMSIVSYIREHNNVAKADQGAMNCGHVFMAHLVFCSQVDWDELAERLMKMQEDCKASWDHLRAVVKHDNNVVVKIRSQLLPSRHNKYSDCLLYTSDAADE